MSSDAQETYATLMQVDKLLADIEAKITKIEGEVAANVKSGGSLQKQVQALNVISVTLTQIAGTNRISEAVRQMEALVNMVTRVYMLTEAISVARNAALGPIGWVGLGANAVGIGLSAQYLVGGTV